MSMISPIMPYICSSGRELLIRFFSYYPSLKLVLALFVSFKGMFIKILEHTKERSKPASLSYFQLNWFHRSAILLLNVSRAWSVLRFYFWGRFSFTPSNTRITYLLFRVLKRNKTKQRGIEKKKFTYLNNPQVPYQFFSAD